jgi:hypothetical protein
MAATAIAEHNCLMVSSQYRPVWRGSKSSRHRRLNGAVSVTYQVTRTVGAVKCMFLVDY